MCKTISVADSPEDENRISRAEQSARKLIESKKDRSQSSRHLLLIKYNYVGS